jgi:ribosomal protein L19E
MNKEKSELAKELRELREALEELNDAIEMDRILFNRLFGK